MKKIPRWADLLDARGATPFVWHVGLVGIALVLLVANWPLVSGRATPIFDADSQFAPWQMLVADYARAGRVLLWNPWSNGGSPDFIDPQVGAFSPVNIFIGALTGGTLGGFVTYWLLIWFAGGAGMMQLARHLGAPPWAGFVVSLGFLFCGALTGHAQHVSHIFALAWLPWIIWRLDVALVRRRWWPAFEAGALWGLSGLAGYPGLVLLTACYASLWALGRWLLFSSSNDAETGSSNQPAGSRVHTSLPVAVLSIVTLLVIGLLVVSPVYLGLIHEGRGYTDRAQELPRKRAVHENPLHPGALSTVASPYLSMLVFYNEGKFWDYTDASSNSIYPGAIVVWLAFCAFMLKPKDRWRWWILALALLSLGLALGQTLPLRGWLYDLFAPSRYFRHPAIFRDYAIFSLTVLAAIGACDLHRVVRNPDRRLPQRLLFSAIATAVIAAIVFAAVMIVVPQVGRGFAKACTHLAIVWLGVCALGYLGWRMFRVSDSRLFVGVIVALGVADALFTYDLGHLTIYDRDRANRKMWAQIASAHSASLDLRDRGIERSIAYASLEWESNKNLPLKISVLWGYSALQNRFHMRWVKDPLLLSTATGAQRIWFSPQVVTVAPTDGAFDAFVTRAQQLKVPPLIIHKPEEMRRPLTQHASEALAPETRDAIATQPGAIRVEFTLKEFTPETLHLVAQCPSNGWLLVTERWSAGWRAEVNHEPVDIWGGNFIFRAVAVERGLNDVRFSYHPFGYPWLLILSWSTLFLVALGSIFARLRRRSDESRLSAKACRVMRCRQDSFHRC